jgi:hypothetical protein
VNDGVADKTGFCWRTFKLLVIVAVLSSSPEIDHVPRFAFRLVLILL